MSSPPGFPSAHPASFVPVTLVGGPPLPARPVARHGPPPIVVPHPRRPLHPCTGPAPAGVPLHLATALDSPARPATVTAAGVLWILTAAAEVLVAFVAFATGELPVLVEVIALALGLATAASSVAMLRGSDAARTAVVVLGGVGGVVLVPVVLFVPAAILSLHPSSTAWFTDARLQRRAPSPG